MKIGIDIDGVLTNYQQYVIQKGTEYGKKKKIGKYLHPDTLNTAKIFGWSHYHVLMFWITHIFDYAENNPILEDSNHIIKKLKEENYEIHIITSRWLASSRTETSFFKEILWKKKMRDTVRSWLQKNGILYDKLVFIKGDKSRYITKHHIDIMIEDNPKNIKKISRVAKVICYDWSYNQEVRGENIYHASNWKEIDKRIHEIVK